MSRTSRRVSRPLIAVLAVIVALGIVFTLHQVHAARAAQAKKAAPLALAGDPSPLSVMATTVQPRTPSVIVVQPPPSLHPTATLTPPPAPSALVTQTPLEKVSSDPTTDLSDSLKPSVTAPAANVTETPAVSSVSPPTPTAAATIESSDNDAKGLEQWAKGSVKPTVKVVTDNYPTPATPASPATATPLPVLGQSVPPPSVHTEISLQPVADAKTKLDAGDLISARQILNDTLISGHGPDPESLKKQIAQINETLVFSPRKFPEDPWGGSYQVASGERLGNIAARNNVSWELIARVNGITPKKLRSGQWIKLIKGPFHAVIYKHLFRMELYLGAPGGPGSMYIRSFQVGLGKDNSTPTGLWLCKAGDKIRNPRYYPPRGGDVIAPDDPKNPLAGYWIALEGTEGQALGKESYGIHGTIDPDSIGKMESMGCIRLRADDISWVFDLLVDGKSKVLVKD